MPRISFEQVHPCSNSTPGMAHLPIKLPGLFLLKHVGERRWVRTRPPGSAVGESEAPIIRHPWLRIKKSPFRLPGLSGCGVGLHPLIESTCPPHPLPPAPASRRCSGCLRSEGRIRQTRLPSPVNKGMVDIVGEKTSQSNTQCLACPIEIGRLDPKSHSPAPASRTGGLGCNDVDPLGSQFPKDISYRPNAILTLN